MTWGLRTRAHKTIVIAAMLLGLSACAQQRIAGQSCGLKLLAVNVNHTPTGQNYGVELARAAIIPPAERPARHLVLSGGGKWGAFGAGYLQAMPALPVYRVVTGVSTGALQASFAFIGNEPVPAERAAIYTEANDLVLGPGDPQPGHGRRFIDDLSRAYTVSRPETIIRIHGDEITALRHGAAADFNPLRARLKTLLDQNMIARIAKARRDDHRGLYVGVVDMDDGQAYAIDLTELAVRAAAPGADFAFYQRCYIDALIASSSEPLEVAPVFIKQGKDSSALDNRMYLDGGIRDGVFLEEVLTKSGDAGIEAAEPEIDTTVIVNGDLTVRDYTRQPDDKWQKQWSLLTLVARTKDMLVNQIYQFSVDRVTEYGSERGPVRLVTARKFEDHEYTFGDVRKNCQGWREHERDLAAFPPVFMRCLIDYGRAKAVAPDPAQRWDTQKSAATVVRATGEPR